MPKDSYLLKNAVIITPFKTLKGYDLIIEDGKIHSINFSIDLADKKKYKIIDLEGKYYLCPGFIDIHTHGGGGEDCLGGDVETISRFKAKQGITGYLPTFIASPMDEIFNSLDLIKDFIFKNKTGTLPNILGLHIEGIYLNKKYKGAQPLEYLRKPDVKECYEIIKRANGLLKIMTLAPEVEGCMEVIELLSENGIISSVGHSDASPEIIDKAIGKGLSHATHAFNAMGEMGFKEPGVRSPGLEGYMLVKDELKIEIIGEKTHVDPSIMELAYRAKKAQNIIIVTDSMSISGLEPGRYKIGVMNLTLEKGSDVGRLEDGGLAGSAVPINKAIKTFYENTSASLNEAIQMATYNPLKSISLTHRKGIIGVGMDADIAIFDKDFTIKKVFVGGGLAFDENL